jgi:hypothetical protein
MTTRAEKIFLFFGILIGVISASLGLETHKANLLGWVLLFAGITLSSIGAIQLGVLYLRGTQTAHMRDRTLWLPVFGVLAISLTAPLEYLFMRPILGRSGFAQFLGLLLIAGAIFFYLRLLKAPHSTSSLVGGHPLAASLLLFSLGLSIGYSSLVGLLIVSFVIVPGLVYRVKMEDRKTRLIK